MPSTRSRSSAAPWPGWSPWGRGPGLRSPRRCCWRERVWRSSVPWCGGRRQGRIRRRWREARPHSNRSDRNPAWWCYIDWLRSQSPSLTQPPLSTDNTRKEKKNNHKGRPVAHCTFEAYIAALPPNASETSQKVWFSREGYSQGMPQIVDMHKMICSMLILFIRDKCLWFEQCNEIYWTYFAYDGPKKIYCLICTQRTIPFCCDSEFHACRNCCLKMVIAVQAWSADSQQNDLVLCTCVTTPCISTRWVLCWKTDP